MFSRLSPTPIQNPLQAQQAIIWLTQFDRISPDAVIRKGREIFIFARMLDSPKATETKMMKSIMILPLRTGRRVIAIADSASPLPLLGWRSPVRLQTL